jgi:thioredoxin reductase (NADPH)
MSVVKKTKTLIIGSGPAGYSAAIYAARANLQPIMVAGMQPGGQLTITTDVENYPGFADVIQGPWLMEQMQKQAEKVGTEIIYDNVEKIDFSNKPFKAWDLSGTEYQADSVIIATGAQAKWLGLESESKFQGFGVSGCATCDGFFFKDQNVAVIGGGNTAVEEALYLTNHAKKVYLIHRRDELRAEKMLQERLLKHKKIEVIWDSALEEIMGTEKPQKKVTSAKIKNLKTNILSNLDVSGIFIAIGHRPNTDLFKNIIKMDNTGYIITAPDSTKTNIAGIYAAGDVQDHIYRQAVTAAGTGCMAALEAEKYLAEN